MLANAMNDSNSTSTPGGFASGSDLQELIEPGDDEHGAVYIDETDGDSDEANTNSKKPYPLHYDSPEQNSDDSDYSEWNLDLSLGKEVYLSSNDEIRFLSGRESVSIKPGEFALLITEEKVDIPPSYAAFISLKFTYALEGLINISGFHVDPNYSGRIIFSVYNAGPSATILRRKEPVFMIVFASLTQPIGNGNRSDDAEFDEIERIGSDMMSGLQGRTTSLESLDDTVDRIEQRQNILVTLLGTLLVTIIGFVILQGVTP